jgi:uncharacterized protein (TIGR00296 family)
MQLLSLQDGRTLIKLARKTVENFLEKGKFELMKVSESNKALQKKSRAFVSIHTYPEHVLRGCVGFTAPFPLWEVMQRAAYAAAFKDPRFPPITKEELEKVVFEVSTLTEPEELKCNPSEYANNIEIGKDGLIIQCGSRSGLLLPQVAIEQNCAPEEFLGQVCFKAGLTPDYLYDKSTKLWKFQAQIFAENEPNGEVEEIKFEK